MFELLYDPIKQIKYADKHPSFSRVLLMLVASSLFFTAGVLFFCFRFASLQEFIVLILFGALFGFLAFMLICAFFLSLALHVLGGKGGYYEGLTSYTLGMVAISVMLFFAGALSFIPFIGLPIAGILLMYGFVIGFSITLRCTKELFGVGYVVAFVSLFFIDSAFSFIAWIAYFIR